MTVAPEPVEAPVKVYLLGRFRVVVNGQPLANDVWRRRKARQLFKCLLTSPRRRLVKDEAFELLWPDSDAVAASANLRSAVHAIRRALATNAWAGAADAVVVDRETVGLRQDAEIWVDADAFEQAVAEAQDAVDALPLLEKADALYVGDYLPDDLYEDWATGRRERLRRLWTQLQFSLARHRAARRDPERAASALQRLVDADACDERAAQELIKLLIRQGRRSDGLRVFQRLVQALRNELEVEPSQATLELERELAAGEPMPSGGTELPARPPAGTVTFLFTDVEGSTQHWEEQPDAMRGALARHDALLREAIGVHDGYIFKTVGDAFCAAFGSAADALAAAVAAQRSLREEPWPEATTLRVRMALHTGVAEERGGDYFGPPLNRVARLLAAGHGGQVLLSEVTAGLARDSLPANAELLDLGEHSLKDLARREPIFQLAHPDLPAEFSPLRTLDTLPNNLPRQLTSFIGREREIAEVKRLLTATPLLTLTGAAGAGKTRLALQVAAELLETYRDGVWLVELSPLTDPALVVETVASALSVQEEPRRPLIETLIAFLKPRSLLLVLDNCEHLVAACATLAETLLRACPRLQILATSRETLTIAGEITWRVPSLSLPDLLSLPPLEMVRQYEAVRLFVERATAVRPSFTAMDQHVLAVVQVCHRLDGIPLAIELAAARVSALSPEQIAARLDDRFQLLTGGSRTALPRQQTLHGALDWSYDLLPEQERLLLRRLAVFAGGWTLEAVEAVCSTDGIEEHEVLHLVSRLVDKSLVLAEEHGDEVRYRFLETIRQYAAEKLRESGEERSLRERHRDWFLGLAERGEAELKGPEQAAWFGRLGSELDNLRAALDWDKIAARPAAEQAPNRDAEAGLRLGSALGFFWVLRGHLHEGREWLVQMLALPSGRTPMRAKALATAGWLAYLQGDHSAARSLLEESLAMGQEVADTACIARSLQLLGLVAYGQLDYPGAMAFLEESLTLARQSGDRVRVYGVLENLADVAWAQRDFERMRALHAEALALKRGHGDKHGIAYSLRCLGDLERIEGQYDRATELYMESLTLVRELEDRLCICRSLDGLALVASAQGLAEAAARLFGVAEATREAVGFALSPDHRAEYDRGLATVRAALGPEALAAVWSKVRTVPLEQAIAYALERRPSA